ncbi:MAG TPA: hydrogenase [Actinobacteria bacterium]|nr:hydrogenase [Actinomycetota bacterium]
MGPAHAPGVFTGGANVIAAAILLAEFGMFRQALVRDQVRLYAAQSGLVSVLAVIVGAVHHLPELYVLAALSAALKVVVIPLVLRRLLWGNRPAGAGTEAGDIAGSGGLGLAATVLVAIAVAAFGFFAAGRIPVPGSAAPAIAFSVSVAVVLVAFVLMIHRRDVISQAIGLFSLENGISLAALVVAASLPLILEVALLFDLLVAAIVFGLLIRIHHGRAESLSTTELTSLRG